MRHNCCVARGKKSAAVLGLKDPFASLKDLLCSLLCCCPVEESQLFVLQFTVWELNERKTGAYRAVLLTFSCPHAHR